MTDKTTSPTTTPYFLNSLIGLLILSLTSTVALADKNGFNLDGSLVPETAILGGGPPRDGIPALYKPRFIKANQAKFLRPDSRVLGIEYNGVKKAYPIKILNWHEIVNDRFNQQPLVISFCPLCGTGVAFMANTPSTSQTLHFGVSGLLYNSDVLLYDRETESLWSQIMSQAISGPYKGTELEMIPLSHTSWQDWRERHPDTLVLSTKTGFSRDYNRDPYAGYSNSEGLYFPVTHRDPRYHPKERVIGVQINDHFKAYPFSELAQTSGPINDRLDGVSIQVSFDPQHQTAMITDEEGEPIAAITAMWFAWMAFHPDSAVYKAP